MPTTKALPTDRAAWLAAARKRDLSRIHMLRADLKLSDDEYRDLVASLFDGKRSSTDLAFEQRRSLIDHLVGLQKKYRLPVAKAKSSPRPVLSPTQRKMFSLWQQLADAGLVRDRKMSALQAWVTNEQKLDRWEWLTSSQERTVIEKLKSWLARRDGGACPADGHG